jgi:hypothetical protein
MKTIWKRNSSWAEATEADAIIDELSEISPILAKYATITVNNENL